MRKRIRAVAGDLYILRGYGGFSFGDVADADRMRRRRGRAVAAQATAAWLVAIWTGLPSPVGASSPGLSGSLST